MESLLERLRKIPLQIKKSKKLNLPEVPGIYIFFKDETPIYIGKAINLRRRVSSYFDLDLELKTRHMVTEANFLSFIKVTSELEALLLEAQLIRKYMPHYNIAAKDDKHALYIVITKEKYPRILSARKLVANGYRLVASFGPFPSSSSVRSVLKMLRRIFPYSDHKLGKRKCLYSQIGLCNPCPNEIVQSDDSLLLRKKYLRNIRLVKSVLSGKFKGVRSDLEKEMEFLSGEQKYEEAKVVRNQIERLDYITTPQMPTDFYLENPNLYEDTRNKEIKELKTILIENGISKMKNLVRIECFDVAHLSGTSATASMVTFVNAEADKNFYRHFKLRRAKGGNDYDSMSEIAKRREKHFSDWGKPDLIIVDGSIGQVRAFKINSLVVGIAKNPDRLIIGDNKIKLTGPALNLVSRIRNEAHRFARRYHHNLISKVYQNKT